MCRFWPPGLRLCLRATKATVPEVVAHLPEWLRGQKRPQFLGAVFRDSWGAVGFQAAPRLGCFDGCFVVPAWRPALDLLSLPRLDVLKVER